MIKVVEGNLLMSGCKLIAHQVNCLGVMGGGVAAQIRMMYPVVNKTYEDLVKKVTKEHCKEALAGEIQIITVLGREPGNIITTIINMFSQIDIGWSTKNTMESAFRDCCSKIVDYMNANDITEVAMPYKIGCVRGGAEWSNILPIIEEYFGNNSSVNCTLYKLDLG